MNKGFAVYISDREANGLVVAVAPTLLAATAIATGYSFHNQRYLVVRDMATSKDLYWYGLTGLEMRVPENGYTRGHKRLAA